MGGSGGTGPPGRGAEGADLLRLLLVDLRRAGGCDGGDPRAGGQGERDRVLRRTGERWPWGGGARGAAAGSMGGLPGGLVVEGAVLVAEVLSVLLQQRRCWAAAGFSAPLTKGWGWGRAGLV